MPHASHAHGATGMNISKIAANHKIFRISDNTGELFLPHRFSDGCFRVADRRLGKTKHHSKNQIAVRDEENLIAFIRCGYPCRMRGQLGKKINLIRPEEIILDGSAVR